MRLHLSHCRHSIFFLVLLPLFGHTGAAQTPTMRLPRSSVPTTTEFAPRPSTLGYLAADVPVTAVPEEAFNINLVMVAREGVTAESTRVYFNPIAHRIRYEPDSVLLAPGTRAAIRVTVPKTRSGLLEIDAAANRWSPLHMTINAGFRGKLQSSLDSKVESGRAHTFIVTVVDSANQPLPMDVPVTLRLSATGASLRSRSSSTGEWISTLDIILAKGASTSKLVEIKSNSRSGSTAHLMAEIIINRDVVLVQTPFQFVVALPWWISLMYTTMGGLLYGLYQTVKKSRKAENSFPTFDRSVAFPTIVSGVAAGVAAYVLAGEQILGIATDSTSPRGFVFLGMLFAHLGIEEVLNTIKPRTADARGENKSE